MPSSRHAGGARDAARGGSHLPGALGPSGGVGPLRVSEAGSLPARPRGRARRGGDVARQGHAGALQRRPQHLQPQPALRPLVRPEARHAAADGPSAAPGHPQRGLVGPALQRVRDRGSRAGAPGEASLPGEARSRRARSRARSRRSWRRGSSIRAFAAVVSRPCCSTRASSPGSATICARRSSSSPACDPALRPVDLTDAQRDRLARAALELTRRSYRTRGITNDPKRSAALRAAGAPRTDVRHHVFGRDGRPCWDCGTRIRRIEAAGRRLYLCPRCQP